MRFKYLAFITIVTWLIIICMVVFDKPNISPALYSVSLSDSLTELEKEIKNEYQANAKFIATIKKAIDEQAILKNAAAEEESAYNDQVRKEDERRLQAVAGSGVIAVLVFACNRVSVTRCLDQLIKYRPGAERFPIVVSQDCQHEATSAAIQSYGSEIFHIKQPDQSDIIVPPKEKKFKGYFKIARHYGWALDQIFNVYNFSSSIIIEDDLDVSSDLFSYFIATLPLLKNDPTLWCVSAWNDNGKVDLIDVKSPELLHRTDFFPGLGWMLTRELWMELGPKWPASYWDDWIRQPEQRKGRACIRPEVSRTKTFGNIGVSNGLFYEKHLKFIHLNKNPVVFTNLNLTYLLKDNYDSAFVRAVYESPTVTYQELKAGQVTHPGSVRIPYHNKGLYKAAAKALGLMDDFRSGVPRTGYRGVISFFYKGRRVYLAPPPKWNGYNISWS